ncbi:MAG: sigma factor-like helix-turn-helix DNA-binding protein [Peptostreptococcaceae bacterium]
MENRPKRRRCKDNPYKLCVSEKSKYTVEFIDGKGTFQKVEVDKELFDVFDKFELVDKSQLTKTEKYIASFDLSEEYINKNKTLQEMSMVDELIIGETFEELRNAIEKLPELQKKRIKMYYFSELTVVDIAKIEKTTHQAVSKSIRDGINKLVEIIKK